MLSSMTSATKLSSENPEKNKTIFLNVFHSSAVPNFGHTFRKHLDWFDENDDEIKSLIEEKHRLHKASKYDTDFVSRKVVYRNMCKIV